VPGCCLDNGFQDGVCEILNGFNHSHGGECLGFHY
jgi:hypothetical protein